MDFIQQLNQKQPPPDPTLLKYQALELAVEELRNRLSPSDSDDETPDEFLDQAMKSLRPATPHG